MASSVSSPAFIGRKPELARIAAALEGAGRGGPRLLLIAGEAGVGKTRLIDEATKRARERGARVLLGGCVEFGGAGLAFAPVTEALRTLLHDVPIDERAELLGPTTTDLRRLLPELDSRAASEVQHGVGRDSAQSRLFEAFLGLLRRLAARQPLLFVIENLHWADRSTLDLVAYITHGPSDAEFVTVTTFRSDELDRHHPLQPFLAEFHRAKGIERLDLARFNRSEVAEQVAAIGGIATDPDLVDRVFARSDGNAFYTEELLAADVPANDLPAQMRDVLLARVATSSDGTQELLRMASASGPRITTRILAEVANEEESILAGRLREAVERHILVPVGNASEEMFSFRHALVQEAVYGDLLPGERGRLHARYGEALAASTDVGSGLYATELAYHWLAVQDLGKALEASILAAREAERVRAFGDAHSHLERALELWDRVPDAETRTGLDRVSVLERTARAASEKAAPRAMALMREAIREAEGATDPIRLGLLHEQLGRYSWNAGDGSAALAACREAVRLVPSAPPTIARARVTASLGQILVILLQSGDRTAICEEAVSVARLVGAAALESHALNSLGLARFYAGDLEAGLVRIREALDIALHIGSVDDAARAYANLVDVLNHGGHLSEAAEAGEEGFAYFEATGAARFMGVASLCEGASALYRLGRWADAAGLVDRARQYEAAGNAEIFIQERLALLDVGQGRHLDAAARLDRLRVLVERAVEGQWIGPLAEAAAELMLWQGRPAQARAEIRRAFERLPTDEPAYISRIGVLFTLGLRAEADLSAVARARRMASDLAESRDIRERLLGDIRGLHKAAVAGFPGFAREAEAWLSLSAAEVARADGSNDAARWAEAAAAFGAIPMAYPRAYALWRLSEASLASRHRSSAADALHTAHAVALELGAGPLRHALETLAARSRIELDAPSAQLRPASAAPDGLGLTARELEVLELLAAGLSNRQIGATLFVTESTAGVHVSHILAKLDVQSRTEAAAVARRLGLIDE